MYTNIPTRRALLFIGNHLREREYPDVPIKALMEALRLVMTMNVFQFGDTYWKQISGTAMGTPPAPPYAILYYAINEEQFLDDYPDNLFLYKRFIDDVLGLWTISDPATDDATWLEFQSRMNNPAFELEWEFSNRSHTVDFMDLTLTTKDTTIHTTLYEKPSNLHLYIPPHSSHPPGLIHGIVFGMLFRIYTLCTDQSDCRDKTLMFLHRLLIRGYKMDQLKPLFLTAIARAKAYTGPDPDASDADAMKKTLFLHVQYHPKTPPSSVLQTAWKKTLSTPPGSRPLSQVRNYAGQPIGIDRMIVAYNRPPNLGNLLSYRRITTNTGPPVSSPPTGATRDV
jgi:hypothetical protein